MDTDEESLNKLTEVIIGCCFRVHNTLGGGFAEKVYENSQCLNYLAATTLPICLLINFGRKVEVKRFRAQCKT